MSIEAQDKNSKEDNLERTGELKILSLYIIVATYQLSNRKTSRSPPTIIIPQKALPKRLQIRFSLSLPSQPDMDSKIPLPNLQQRSALAAPHFAVQGRNPPCPRSTRSISPNLPPRLGPNFRRAILSPEFYPVFE